MKPIQVILHPMDFFEQVPAALSVASSLARDHKARLIVLHVVPPALTYHETAVLVSGEEKGASGQASLEHPKARLLQHLRRFAPPASGVQIEHHVLEGDPVATIIAFADDVNADLIVMGTHGRTGLSRLLMGSVAEQVVRKATCPVLTVKTSESGAESHESLPSDASREDLEKAAQSAFKMPHA